MPPTSCAAPDEAVHGTAKPSDATGTPSCDTVMAGAGLMATVEAPPVEALASTEGGAVTFSVKTATRIGGVQVVTRKVVADASLDATLPDATLPDAALESAQPDVQAEEADGVHGNNMRGGVGGPQI